MGKLVLCGVRLALCVTLNKENVTSLRVCCGHIVFHLLPCLLFTIYNTCTIPSCSSFFYQRILYVFRGVVNSWHSIIYLTISALGMEPNKRESALYIISIAHECLASCTEWYMHWWSEGHIQQLSTLLALCKYLGLTHTLCLGDNL